MTTKSLPQAEPAGPSYIRKDPGEERRMLETIGAASFEDLLESFPREHLLKQPLSLPEGLSEQELAAALRRLAELNWDLDHYASFCGGGVYDHYVPAAVNHVLSRSEYLTCYTPYQPEVSQGTLQAIFEYQSMICALTGMEVSNASHYDGATALAEAVIMAVNVARLRRKKILVSPHIHPEYRATVRTYTQGMGLTLVGDEDSGLTGVTDSLEALKGLIDDDTAGVLVQNPDFFGRLAEPSALQALADAGHARKALLVVVVDPISLGLFKPPGEYGADVVVGEGQALGNALNFGGPYLGFFACRQKYVRKMAGRLAGQTVDTEGRRGFVLTLSTREQHIRRERATSNICSNEGLVALAAAVYLAALGRCGLRQVAELCYHKAHYAAQQIGQLDGFSLVSDAPFFKEFVVKCPRPVKAINDALLEWGIIGGYDLGRAFPGLDDLMLLCVTEMNSREDIDELVAVLEEVAGG